MVKHNVLRKGSLFHVIQSGDSPTHLREPTKCGVQANKMQKGVVLRNAFWLKSLSSSQHIGYNQKAHYARR